jgi:Protein of unknown function (DUF3047)
MGSARDWRKIPASLSWGRVRAFALILVLLAPLGTAGEEQQPPLQETPVDVHSFRVVESYSGPVSYYKIVEEPSQPFIRATYRPPLETVTLGAEVPENLRQHTKRIRWKWRALTLPKGGNECKPGLGDSAAVVYVSWKRGLKWYSLKYTWSSAGTKGEVCDQKRNLFVVQDTVILQSGGPLNEWRTEEFDPSAEFRAHFEHGDPKADVPDLVGLGIMSDGDQTNSVSSADYTGFTLLH